MAGEYDKSKYTKAERAKNFWYYNKMYIIFAVLVVLFVVVQIHKINHQPKIAFNVMFFNVNSNTFDENGLSDEGRGYVGEFMESMGMDTDKHTVDTQMHLGFEVQKDVTEDEYMTIQNMGAYVSNGDLDMLVADESAFTYIAYWEALEDLRNVLDPETLDKLEPYLFYVDLAVVNKLADSEYGDEEFNKSRPDPRDPSTMEQPIPVGIYLDKSNAKFNENFAIANDVGVVGIYINSKHPELCRAFVDYILE